MDKELERKIIRQAYELELKYKSLSYYIVGTASVFIYLLFMWAIAGYSSNIYATEAVSALFTAILSAALFGMITDYYTLKNSLKEKYKLNAKVD